MVRHRRARGIWSDWIGRAVAQAGHGRGFVSIVTVRPVLGSRMVMAMRLQQHQGTRDRRVRTQL
jgi:hypothetical protein